MFENAGFKRVSRIEQIHHVDFLVGVDIERQMLYRGSILQKPTHFVMPDLDARLVALNIVGILRGSGCSPILNRMSKDHMGMMATLKQILLDGLRP